MIAKHLSPAVFAAAVCLSPFAAEAQTPEAGAAPFEAGISIRANVDLVYQPAFGNAVTLTQTSFATGAMGENATSEYVFEILNQAALAGLNQALAHGAMSGRVTVVATGCHVGVAGNTLKAAAPMGIFVNTTEMERGDDGNVHYRTRVRFIPDTATAPPEDVQN
jgi:hypothetical protein